MNYGFEIFANIIETVIIVQFFVRYFGIKYTKARFLTVTLMTIILSSVMTVSNFIEYISLTQEIVIDIVIFLLTIIFLNGRVLEKLLIVQMTSIVSAVSSMLLTGLFAGWIEYDANGYASFGVSRVVLVTFAQIIYIVFTEYLIYNQIEDRQYVRNATYLKLNIVIFVTLAGHDFLTWYVYERAVSGGIKWQMYVIMIALTVTDLIIYQLFVEVINNGIALLKEQMKNQLYDSESKEIQNIKDIYDKTMKARHDMKSVLLKIRLMLRAGEIEQLEHFLDEELDVRLAAFNIIATGNRLADAVLNRYAERAAKDGIDFIVNIECIPEKINEMDLAIILSNLLDNAFEAVENLSDEGKNAPMADDSGTAGGKKWVSVRINRKDSYMNIAITNSCNPDLAYDSAKSGTTKKEADMHGYGIANVKDIINKNDGLYECTVSDSVFRTNVILYIQE